MHKYKAIYVILSILSGYIIIYGIIVVSILLMFLIIPIFTWNYECPIYLYNKVSTNEAIFIMYQFGTIISLIATLATLFDDKKRYNDWL